MQLEIEYETYRLTDDGEDEEYYIFEVEGEYDPGESRILTGHPDRWRPGAPPSVEITSLHRIIDMQGPLQEGKKRPVYREKWDYRKLTDDELKGIEEQFMEEAERAIEEAKTDAAIDAYESRMDMEADLYRGP